MSGERAAVDEETTDSWKAEVLHSVLSRYHPRDVFNDDETSLFWRLLPDKTLAFKHEKCHGGKSKERVTAMVCTNMDGSEKWPLLVIGKFQNPRCFKRIRKLPVSYEANKCAWMTSELFLKWVRSFDAEMTKAKRKVLLVIDNCTSQIIADLKATELLFLPPNATAKLQPCDCGIIMNLKSHYRSLMLRKLLQHIDLGKTAGEFSITLLDSLVLLEKAWDLVTMTTVEHCFRKAGFSTDVDQHVTPDDSNLTLVIGELIERGVIDASFTGDDSVEVDSELSVTSGLPSVSEVLASLQQHPEENGRSEGNESDEDDCGDELMPVSHTEASNCLQKLRVFAIQKDADSDLLKQINKLEKDVDAFTMKHRVQPTIESFFNVIN